MIVICDVSYEQGEALLMTFSFSGIVSKLQKKLSDLRVNEKKTTEKAPFSSGDSRGMSWQELFLYCMN